MQSIDYLTQVKRLKVATVLNQDSLRILFLDNRRSNNYYNNNYHHNNNCYDENCHLVLKVCFVWLVQKLELCVNAV